MAIPQDWMPSGMPLAEKDAYTDANPGDPHRAAAEAWEDWAAQMVPSALDAATSVQTGSQSVAYKNGGASAFDQAQNRAKWHRARMKPGDVRVAPRHVEASLAYGERRAGSENLGDDTEVYPNAILIPDASRPL